MVRKTDSPAKRMRQLRHHGHKSKRTPSTFQILRDDTGASQDVLSLAWDKAARAALRIEDMTKWVSADGAWHDMPPDFVDPSARAMRRAFEHFKLDPADPWSWRLLVSYYSYVEFWEQPKRRVGTKKKWTAELLEKLRLEIADKKLEKISHKKAATRLINDKSSAFATNAKASAAGGDGAEILRKKIGQVKRQARNAKPA